MAKEKKVAHDYFLDCCKKYGVEVVSDRQVRSHFETIVKFEGVEHKVQTSIYGHGKERELGIFCFKTTMASHYLYKEPRDLENYDKWANNKDDILYEPRAKESDLKEIYKLLDKALTIANKSDKDAVPENVLKGLSDVVGVAFGYLKTRGEV